MDSNTNSSNLANLNVLISGKKNNLPALVFLHYFGGSSKSWRTVIELLESDFYCVAPDLRGFGESPNADEFGIEKYARDIIQLIEQLNTERYVLIGHSMGGKIALAVAAEQPVNLLSLILFAPSPPTPEPMKESERERMLTTHGSTKAAEETIARGISRELTSEILATAIKANLQSSEAAWKWWLETGSRREIISSMKKIKIPIFAAVGADDENMTAELIDREIISRVERGELAVIEYAKHLIPLEAAPEAVQFIRDALGKITSSKKAE